MPLRPRLALKVHDVEPIGDEVAGVEDGGRTSVALAQHALLVARPFHVLQRNGWAWSLTARPTLTSSNPPLDIAGTLTAIVRLSTRARRRDFGRFARERYRGGHDMVGAAIPTIGPCLAILSYLSLIFSLYVLIYLILNANISLPIAVARSVAGTSG